MTKPENSSIRRSKVGEQRSGEANSTSNRGTFRGASHQPLFDLLIFAQQLNLVLEHTYNQRFYIVEPHPAIVCKPAYHHRNPFILRTVKGPIVQGMTIGMNKRVICHLSIPPLRWHSQRSGHGPDSLLASDGLRKLAQRQHYPSLPRKHKPSSHDCATADLCRLSPILTGSE